MERYLSSFLKRDNDKKIVLLSGPRQSGKTTLAKSLYENATYLNYDLAEDRLALSKKQWRRDVDCILFDELPKMPEWKRWLKGIYDSEGNRPRLFVTGSANLESWRKVGDSLAGRYFSYRLHPLDLKEALMYWKNDPQHVFDRLMMYSGFPEPFLEGNDEFYRRWQKTHLDIILRQDFLDLFSIRSLKAIEILLDLLRPRVGSSTSTANIARDLQADPKSVQSWLMMLENIYTIYRVTPYHHNIARSLLKEPKFYFYDIARVPDKAARLENLVASALLKEIHFLDDVYGFRGGLHYLRTKDGDEIDFLITRDDQPLLLLEVKTTDDTPSKSFNKFRKFIGNCHCIQLVLNLNREFDTQDGIQVRQLIPYLANLDLNKLT